MLISSFYSYLNRSVAVAALLLAAASARAECPGPAQPSDPVELRLALDAMQAACMTDPGHVAVDLAFDFQGGTVAGDGRLDSTEIQCAIDCLDGDKDPERQVSPLGHLQSPASGVIELDPTLTYDLDETVRLPLLVDGMLILRGRGVTLDVSADVALERSAPAGANNADLAIMARHATGWLIEDLGFRYDGSGGQVRTGLRLHGTNALRIESCGFENFDVGIELRFAPGAVVEGTSFAENGLDVLLAGRKVDATNQAWSLGADPALFPAALNLSPEAGGMPTWTGSPGAVVRLTHHYCSDCEQPILVQDSDAVSIQESRFLGDRPSTSVIRKSDLEGVKGVLWMRNLRFDVEASAVNTPLIKHEGDGAIILEASHVALAGLVVDARGTEGSWVIARDLLGLPTGSQMAADGDDLALLRNFPREVRPPDSFWLGPDTPKFTYSSPFALTLPGGPPDQLPDGNGRGGLIFMTDTGQVRYTTLADTKELTHD